MSEAANEELMSSVRRKVSTGKPGGRSTSEGVDRLVLTASLRVDKPKVNISFPEKPAVNEVPDKVKDILVVGVTPEGDSAPEAKIGSSEVERETKVEDVAAEDVQAADTPAADSPAADSPAADGPATDISVADTQAEGAKVENIDDRDILTSEPSVLKTDGVIDEDMLRDIISDIVREELQGDLGEKITRNVRRLVRREIHRTMVSNQLE